MLAADCLREDSGLKSDVRETPKISRGGGGGMLACSAVLADPISSSWPEKSYCQERDSVYKIERKRLIKGAR